MEAADFHKQLPASLIFLSPSWSSKHTFAMEHGDLLPWVLGAVGRRATKRARDVGAERRALGQSQRSRPRARCPVSPAVMSKQVLGAAVLHPSIATEPGPSLSGPERARISRGCS